MTTQFAYINDAIKKKWTVFWVLLVPGVALLTAGLFVLMKPKPKEGENMLENNETNV